MKRKKYIRWIKHENSKCQSISMVFKKKHSEVAGTDGLKEVRNLAKTPPLSKI